MKMAVKDFITQINQTLETFNKQQPNMVNNLVVMAVDVFDGVRDDSQLEEVEDVGLLVVELMSTLAEHFEDRVNEMKDKVKKFDKIGDNIYDATVEIDELIDRLERVKNDLEEATDEG